MWSQPRSRSVSLFFLSLSSDWQASGEGRKGCKSKCKSPSLEETDPSLKTRLQIWSSAGGGGLWGRNRSPVLTPPESLPLFFSGLRQERLKITGDPPGSAARSPRLRPLGSLQSRRSAPRAPAPLVSPFLRGRRGPHQAPRATDRAHPHGCVCLSVCRSLKLIYGRDPPLSLSISQLITDKRQWCKLRL